MIDKSLAVEKLFAALDKEISTFQSNSSLHCKAGCGKCCFKADIEATVLEFIPFALAKYKEGTAMEWLRKLDNADSPLCVILNPTQSGAGLCSQYAYRGLICRLFGYSARTNKYGKKELVTCEIIKTEQSDAYQLTEQRIEAGEPVPVMSNFYMQLHGIDPDLARDFFPINRAIKKALENVLQYYAYRDNESVAQSGGL